MSAEPRDIAELRTAVEALTARVDDLEAEVRTLRARLPGPEVSPEVVVAISAAVAAYLGLRARVKQIHYRSGAAWAQQGRAAVQGHQIVHGVR